MPLGQCVVDLTDEVLRKWGHVIVHGIECFVSMMTYIGAQKLVNIKYEQAKAS